MRSNNKVMQKIVKEIVDIVKKENPENKKELYKIKKKVCSKYGMNEIISDSEIIKYSGRKDIKVLGRKPSRALSGVSVVAVMSKPYKCPHGKCVFCPGGVSEGTPQSYTGHEPAAMRGKHNSYNAFNQVKSRLKQYNYIGKNASKVELIIMGGTFTNKPWSYQKSFITDCFKALNDSKINDLKKLHEMNETSRHRCVGMTIETRPDEISKKSAEKLLSVGCTRVELGVQILDDNILEKNKRGHTVKDIINSVRILKNHGFKINYHIMTNMFGSSPEKDLKCFKKVFSDSRFRPDMLKIYPTLLIKGTELYELYKKGEWSSYSKEETINLVSKMKNNTPEYVRIMRIMRDIPSFKILNLNNSNLRQIVQEKMDKECRCIRCREAGRNKESNINNAVFKKKEYEASGGKEYFIEYSDNNNNLFGFIRLRKHEKLLFVRELHVYGKETVFGEEGKIQHRGIGKKLMNLAEKIGIEEGVKEIRVISGVGVRGYYKKLGYSLKSNYMIKNI